ncbi:MAG: OmpA family protein [Acidimicrobiales bacterium]|nr:OmpA family protein [Acidimicrobiales bacterium]
MSTPTSPRKLLALGAAIALAGGLLASCGGDDDTDAALDDTTTTTAAPTTTEGDTTTTTEAPDGDVELVWVVEADEEAAERDNISSLMVGLDGDTLYSGHFQAVRVRHVADGELVEVFLVDHTAESLAFTPDGDQLAVGLGVGGVSVHDPATGDEMLRLGSGNNHRAAVYPDGATLATGSRDGNVILWSLPDGAEQATLADPAPDGGPMGRAVVGLDWHPDGDQLAVTRFDCTVEVWDTVAGNVIHELELYSGDGSCGLATSMLTYTPDAEYLVGALQDDDGQSVVRFWSLDGFEAAFDVPVPERVRDLDFSPDGSILAVGSRLATSVVDVDDQSVLYTFDQDIAAAGLVPRPSTIAFTVDGGHVAVGWDDGRLELWRLPGAEELVAPEREACDPVPIPGDVLFDTGSSDLRSDADAALTELAEQLADSFPDATLTFVGHTDSRGSADANQQLSLARATSTRDWFATWATDNGIDGWTLDVDGRGDTQLRVPDTNADGDFLPDAGALNRRVEIIIDAPSCA